MLPGPAAFSIASDRPTEASWSLAYSCVPGCAISDEPFARLMTTLPFADATVKVAAPLSWAQPVNVGRLLPTRTSRATTIAT